MGRPMTPEQVREILHYDPDTGDWTWRVYRGGKMKAGQRAGATLAGKRTTYVRINIDRRSYLAHRLAWLYMTGSWPAETVDHIDGNGVNNSWNNLRLANARQSRANSRRRSDNKSGLKGVWRDSETGRWRAGICVNGKRCHLGTFATKEAAFAAYEEAAKTAFGDYACTARGNQ